MDAVSNRGAAKTAARDPSSAKNLRLIFPPMVRLIGRREEFSVQQTPEAVRKQLKLMIERGLYRDIDTSCHVSQGKRADEHLLDEGVRAGNRGTVPRRQDSACRHVRRQNAFLRRSGHTVLLQS